MLKIRNTEIYITRGDSANISVSMQENGQLVPFEVGDTVYFTVKENVNTEQTKIQKVITTFTDGKAEIKIDPLDTKLLPYASYVYDVQINFDSGEVTTIIEPSLFKVESEVTYE